MQQIIQKTYDEIIKRELKVALGCTEPIAVAYAAAKAREVLNTMPESCVVRCSGNIVKNVKGVTVPNSGGLRGIDTAAAIGIMGGDASRELEVLSSVSDEDCKRAAAFINEGRCSCELAKGVENLFINVVLMAHNASSEVTIRDTHSNITLIKHNGEIIYQKEVDTETGKEPEPDKSLLNIRQIIQYANETNMDEISEALERQLSYNLAISQEGLSKQYGAQVGRTILSGTNGSIKCRAQAMAAAGSDARMNGCPMPVVINSGSGNQGITLSMTVAAYAQAYGVRHERVLRALAVANLISVHQKKYIGSLSAYCGAVSAACAAAAAIVYMLEENKPDEQVYCMMSDTITNCIATIGGMVCDGAKSSCASKISAAVGCALTAMDMAKEKHVFLPGEGLVKGDIEETIASIGRMGREGMRETDTEILEIMLEK